MKNLIRNIIMNSENQKMLRTEIFHYFSGNTDVSRLKISETIKLMIDEKIIESKEVECPEIDFFMVEYKLTEE